MTKKSDAALFLDRDGVINKDVGYVYRWEDFSWIEGAIETISLAHKLNFYVFIVTNQSAVARGYCSEHDIRHFMEKLQKEMKEHGIWYDDWRFCPYHPQGIVQRYAKEHPWRKPCGGMIEDLIHSWHINPQKSLLIGDKTTDIKAAHDAGIEGFLFSGHNLYDFAGPLLENIK